MAKLVFCSEITRSQYFVKEIYGYIDLVYQNIYIPKIYIHSDLTIGIEQNTPIRDSVYKSVMLLDSDRCNEELSSVLYVLFKHKNDYLKWKLKNV